MDVSKYLDRAFWTLLSAMAIVLSWVGLTIAGKVDTMSQSVVELNTTMKNVVLQINENKNRIYGSDLKLNDHEKRLIILEQNNKK